LQVLLLITVAACEAVLSF